MPNADKTGEVCHGLYRCQCEGNNQVKYAFRQQWHPWLDCVEQPRCGGTHETAGAPCGTEQRMDVSLEAAREMLEQAEQAVRTAQRVHRGEVGPLTVGFVGSAIAGIFSELLLAFRTRFPEVVLTLQELTTAQQVAALRERRIDVGVLRPPIGEEPFGLETICRESFVVVLPNTHPLAAQRRIPLSAMADETIILVPTYVGPGMRDETVEFCHRAGCYPQRLPGTTQMLTVIGLVAAGMGLSLVPASMRTVRWKGIVYRPVEDQMPPVADLAVAWRRDEAYPVVQAFLGVVREITHTRWEDVGQTR
jgi:DNA-binding transcriptional LysR family regulator